MAVSRQCSLSGAELPNPRAVMRDMSGMTEGDGGAIIPFQVAEQFWDRARSFEPLPRVRFLMTEHREFEFPTVYETSRKPGLRWRCRRSLRCLSGFRPVGYGGEYQSTERWRGQVRL